MARFFGSTCVALVLAAQAPAGAETLGQAIADAYRGNPQLQAQRANLRTIDEQVIQAAAPYRLDASLGGQLTYQNQRVRDPVQDVFFTDRTRTLSTYLSASQIISNGGRTAAQVSVAEASVLAGREQLRQAENQILLEVVDAYISVRRDQQIVAILQRSLDSYQRQVEQAVARERGGDLTQTDIAQARAQREIARSQVAGALAQLEQSRARFTAVVGRNPGVLDPEPPLPGVPASLETAYAVAERESPALWQAILSERAAGAQIAAERAERNPVLGVSGSVGFANPDGYRTRDLGRGYAGQATLTVPLLTRGVVDSRVRSAIAARDTQRFLVENTRRAVDVQVQGAWNQSIAARDQLAAGVAGVEAAQLALVGVRRGFAEGFRSNFELLDSEQRLLNVEVIVANARYGRYAGQALLLAALGRLEAAAIDQAVVTYDAQANLERQRRRQFGPFQVVLQPLDKLLIPSSRAAGPAVLPAVAGAVVAPAATPPPEGGLGMTLPIDPNVVPVVPDADAPPPAPRRAPVDATPAPAAAPASAG